MHRIWAAALTLALAAPALAAEPMSAEEFEAYSTGKTLSYAVGGEIYGAEQYLPGRRVVWAFRGQECAHGQWYEQAGQICFVYEHDATPQCWSFYREASGVRAQFEGDPTGTELSEVSQTRTPLICAGPDVGV
ncbi:hypothetical protein EBL89_13855 [Cereibacter sphaeroides]|uniref:hypothetical protein n=1 Tax=Cereibacter sphaeroides TaxID=1063 RepID=UPI000191C7D3|nr:hypothetical protein [Cereibacter sphaeroides]ACM00011.1 Hypothetical Protein RSKD131_0151 [Cereibacter sphaeroides KD131]AZB56335.1 hypothetical protein EBL89_13855 [Cereibacter sphaeroides]AZB60593.1 hypothetical protein EBL88_13735 [Cereibacter sphaeroides]MWP37523.1 hypothetical protein [Cereibacter sphaeroides]